MNPTQIFWPMIAHVVLVYIVYLAMYRRRIDAVRSGAARVSQFRGRDSEPETSASSSANLMNQFELPVLFHVVCLALFVTAGVSWLALAMAWLFIASRYVHAWVHLTSNRMRYRHPAFLVGAVLVALLWIYFALHLLAII
jgi:hypothetical protein